MSETNHSFETEYADFDLDEEGYGQPEDPYAYADPLEQKVDQITEYLGTQQQEAAEQREREIEEGFEALESDPLLEREDVRERFVERVQQTADAIEREQGQPGLADELLDNPKFATDIWNEEFDGAGKLLNESEYALVRMSRERQSKQLPWES
jgi:plasmid stabilization system protein ParE